MKETTRESTPQHRKHVIIFIAITAGKVLTGHIPDVMLILYKSDFAFEESMITWVIAESLKRSAYTAAIYAMYVQQTLTITKYTYKLSHTCTTMCEYIHAHV